MKLDNDRATILLTPEMSEKLFPRRQPMSNENDVLFEPLSPADQQLAEEFLKELTEDLERDRQRNVRQSAPEPIKSNVE